MGWKKPCLSLTEPGGVVEEGVIALVEPLEVVALKGRGRWPGDLVQEALDVDFLAGRRGDGRARGWWGQPTGERGAASGQQGAAAVERAGRFARARCERSN
jgi:hypothetical protein